MNKPTMISMLDAKSAEERLDIGEYTLLFWDASFGGDVDDNVELFLTDHHDWVARFPLQKKGFSITGMGKIPKENPGAPMLLRCDRMMEYKAIGSVSHPFCETRYLRETLLKAYDKYLRYTGKRT